MKNKKSIAVMLIIILVIVGGVVGFAVVSKTNKNPQTPSTTAQTTNTNTQPSVDETFDDKTNEDAQSFVVETDTSYYNVSEEVGGFFGIILDIKLPKGIDGYELMSVWNFNTKTPITQPLTVNETRLYYSAQEGPREILIRVYDDRNGERVYGEWFTAVDATTAAEKDIDVNTWNELIKDRTQLEPYYWDN